MDGTFMEEVNEAIRISWNFLHNGNGREMSALQLTERKKSDKMEQRVYEIKGELSNVRTFKIANIKHKKEEK